MFKSCRSDHVIMPLGCTYDIFCVLGHIQLDEIIKYTLLRILCRSCRHADAEITDMKTFQAHTFPFWLFVVSIFDTKFQFDF